MNIMVKSIFNFLRFKINNIKANFLFFLLVFLPFLGFSQSQYPGLKYDSLQINLDETKAIVYKKNKVGIYDLRLNIMLLEPKKRAVIFYEETNTFFIMEDGQYGLLKYKEGKEVFNTKLVNFDRFYAFLGYWNFSNTDVIVEIDGKKIDFKSGEFLEQDSVFFAKHITENKLIVEPVFESRVLINYQRPAYRLVEIYDDQFILDTGWARSGLFNLKSGTWDIPEIYKKIDIRDSLLFCLREISDVNYSDSVFFQDASIEYNYVYDIYVLRENEIIAKAKNWNQLSNDEVAKFMGWDKAEILADSIHLIASKNGKKGLWQIELFHDLDFFPRLGSFNFNEILPINYDYIYFNLNDDLISTYNSKDNLGVGIHTEFVDNNKKRTISHSYYGKYNMIYGRFNSEKVSLFKDDEFWYYDDFIGRPEDFNKSKNAISKFDPEFNHERVCGLKKVNDSLIYVLDYKQDIYDSYSIPLKSIKYPEEDSMIKNEFGGYDVIHSGPLMGFERSGIYNVQQNSWFIKPNYQMISTNGKGFLCFEFRRDHNNIMYPNKLYTLYDLKGNIVFEHKEQNDFIDQKNLLEAYLLPNNQKSIHKFPEKSKLYWLNNEKYQHDYFVQNNEGKWQIYELHSGLDNFKISPSTKTKELIQFNVDFPYYVYVENDSIHLDWGDTILSVNSDQGRIEIAMVDYFSFKNYITTLHQGDRSTTIYSFPENSDNSIIRFAEYQMDGDNFIVNQHYTNDFKEQLSNDAIYFDGPFIDKIYKSFDTETSVIWNRNELGVWNIISPYYASIEICSLGYLVKTGAQEFYDPQNLSVIKSISSRTTLIDKNCVPISYMDQLDFEDGRVYDFGVSLRTETGCFLIDNNGKLITAAEWDVFELENGRIKAIKYTKDSYANFLDYGDDLVIENTGYFDLP